VELEAKFSTVMPNHFHGIMILWDDFGGDDYMPFGWDDGMGSGQGARQDLYCFWQA
jgi:hypothetical protein